MLMPEDPQKLQEENRKKIGDNLRGAYSIIERLVQKSYQQKEMDLNFQLRNVRSEISGFFSEVENKNLEKLVGRKGSLEDFYASEDMLLKSSSQMLDFANSCLSSDRIDIVSLESYLKRFEQSTKARVIIDKNILKEFKLKKMEYDSGLKVELDENPLDGRYAVGNEFDPAEVKTQDLSCDDNSSIPPSLSNDNNGELGSEMDTETLSELYNYLNILEHKYSSYQPEVSYDGSYVGNGKWSFDVSDRSIFAEIREGILKTPLTFETFWHPFGDLKSLIQFVQQEANLVSKGQYKSLCIVNSDWPFDIKEWATGYMHPRMILFLYELDSGNLYFNESLPSSAVLSTWHSSAEKAQTLEDDLMSLANDMEYFEASDLMERSGLNLKSAKEYLKKMVKMNRVVDIGFGSSKYALAKE